MICEHCASHVPPVPQCPNCGAPLPVEAVQPVEVVQAVPVAIPTRWAYHPAKKTNHWLHGLLVFMSGGLWAPIWFFVNERNRERWEFR
jgi:hypothetical protein